MTWHKGSAGLASAERVLVTAAIVAAGFAVGCGSDDPRKGITVVEPAAGAELTRADDLDPDVPGVQFDVKVESRGLPEGAQVELFVGGDEEQLADTLLDADGLATFSGVTLPPGVKRITARTSAGTVRSNEDQEYTLRILEITNPEPGIQRRDASSGDEGFQLAVTVEAYAVEGDISLRVGEEEEETAALDETGKALFTIDLDPGDHVLDAVAGEISSDPVEVTVLEETQVAPRCTSIELVTPVVPDGADSYTFSNDLCPTDGAFAVDFTFSTDAGDGRVAKLSIDDEQVAMADIAGTLVTFKEVVLEKRDSAHRLSISIDTEDAEPCEADVDVDFFVDCAGPTCTIASPTPIEVDVGSATVQFLNASKGDGNEFDIEIETSDEAVGQTVQLIVDGNARNPIEVTAVESGNAGAATFADLELPDGEHTLEARCVDGNGNETYSSVRTWTVDVTPCSVEITSPDSDAILSFEDDEDGTASGTQILVEATVGGADCDEYRAGPCDPTDGLSGDASAFTGGPVSVTLDDGMFMQDLCLEIIDTAGNATSDDVAVAFYPGLPEVEIISPDDGVRYNALGNDGSSQAYEADEDASTDACEATLRVQCSAIGAEVSLMRDPSGAADLLATADCETPGAGDTDVAAGFGIAVFSEVDFLAGLAGAPTETELYATQSLSTSAGDLTGESTAIAIAGDCVVPTYNLLHVRPAGASQADPTAWVGECPQLALETGFSDDDYTVGVFSPNATGAVLTVTRVGQSSADSPVMATPQGGAYSFTGVVLGDGSTDGTATLELVLMDDFSNQTTAPTCQVSVLPDVPVLSAEIGSPPGPMVTTFTHTTDVGACAVANSGQFQVPLTLTVDETDASRRLTVGSGGSSTVVDLSTAVANTVSVCVPVMDGSPTLTATLEALLAGSPIGAVQRNLPISVQTLEIASPTAGQQYTSSDAGCAAGLEAKVVVTFDESYPDGTAVGVTANGSTVSTTVANLKAGAAMPVCVALADGTPTDITVNVASSGATDSVTVTGSTDDLTVAAVTGIQADAPDADNPSATDTYRSSPMELSWSLPAGTFFWADYQLRCQRLRDYAANPTAWWDTATVYTAPDFQANPGEESGTLQVPIGATTECVLRACNTDGVCSELPGSTFTVSKPFRRQQVLADVVAADSPNYFGSGVVPIGDVNGDGFEDMAVAGGNPKFGAGGTAQVYLVFGGDVSPADPMNPLKKPDVMFSKPNEFAEIVTFGSSMAGLGDINGDGLDDFAIGAPGRTVTPAGGRAGALYIFFGRPLGDPWDPSIDLSSQSATVCEADVCIYGAEGADTLGAVAGLGDFNGDGVHDVAIGALEGGTGTGAVHVISGESFHNMTCGSLMPAETAPCTRPSGSKVWGVAKTLPSADTDFIGFEVQGDANTRYLGSKVVAVGDVDDQPGDDVLVWDEGQTANPFIAGGVYLLSGRTFDAMPGMQTLPIAGETVVAKAPMGSGAGDFARTIVALGNVYDVPGGTTGLPDLGIHHRGTGDLLVWPGNQSATGFDVSEELTIRAYADGGESACTGEFPAIGLKDYTDSTPDRYLDLDEDGLADFCLGTTLGLDSLPPGDALLGFGVDLASLSGPNPVLPTSRLYDMTPPASTADTFRRIVNYVGDVTGDGYPDLAVGDKPDPAAPAAIPPNEGGLWILY